jgi:hypothetical protein
LLHICALPEAQLLMMMMLQRVGLQLLLRWLQ